MPCSWRTFFCPIHNIMHWCRILRVSYTSHIFKHRQAKLTTHSSDVHYCQLNGSGLLIESDGLAIQVFFQTCISLTFLLFPHAAAQHTFRPLLLVPSSGQFISYLLVLYIRPLGCDCLRIPKFGRVILFCMLAPKYAFSCLFLSCLRACVRNIFTKIKKVIFYQAFVVSYMYRVRLI